MRLNLVEHSFSRKVLGLKVTNATIGWPRGSVKGDFLESTGCGTSACTWIGAGASGLRNMDSCCITNPVTSEPMSMAFGPLMLTGQMSSCSHTRPEAPAIGRSMRLEPRLESACDIALRVASASICRVSGRRHSMDPRGAPFGTIVCVSSTKALFQSSMCGSGCAFRPFVMPTNAMGTEAQWMMFSTSDRSFSRRMNSAHRSVSALLASRKAMQERRTYMKPSFTAESTCSVVPQMQICATHITGPHSAMKKKLGRLSTRQLPMMNTERTPHSTPNSSVSSAADPAISSIGDMMALALS
mmetsp:Transcript_16750/g.37776  ORF Transcript_16750/g.37776 Transcript_16750/m.37776 type:complete len:299 (-) Transcript_16750:453-1349(-)